MSLLNMFQRTLLIIIKSLFTITFYVLDYISNEVQFGTLNVITDSPTSQYCNKSIFWFMQNYASKKCPVRNTEQRDYFCIFYIPLCKVLLCYKFRNLQKFFIYSKYGLKRKSNWIQNRKIAVFEYFHTWWNLVIPITL